MTEKTMLEKAAGIKGSYYGLLHELLSHGLAGKGARVASLGAARKSLSVQARLMKSTDPVKHTKLIAKLERMDPKIQKKVQDLLIADAKFKEVGAKSAAHGGISFPRPQIIDDLQNSGNLMTPRARKIAGAAAIAALLGGGGYIGKKVSEGSKNWKEMEG